MQGRRERGTAGVLESYVEDHERLRTQQIARYRAPLPLQDNAVDDPLLEAALTPVLPQPDRFIHEVPEPHQGRLLIPSPFRQRMQ